MRRPRPVPRATSNASTHPSISYLDSHLQNPQVHEADLSPRAGPRPRPHPRHHLHRRPSAASSTAPTMSTLNLATSSSFRTSTSTTCHPARACPNPGTSLPHGGKPAPLLDWRSLPGPYLWNRRELVNIAGKNGNPPASQQRRLLPHPARRLERQFEATTRSLSQVNKRYRNGFSLLVQLHLVARSGLQPLHRHRYPRPHPARSQRSISTRITATAPSMCAAAS